MSQNIVNLDKVSSSSFSKGMLTTFDSAEFVLFDLLLFFQKHSFPLDSLLHLLSTPQARLFDVHHFISSFLDSNQVSFSDLTFLENLSFLKVNGPLPVPADIAELFSYANSFWRSQS